MENSPATNDQQKQALIETLPNEVIYNIFNFLTTLDVVRGFTQLNHRFDVLVRFHVKEIDLTDSWQGNQQYLQRICETIQTLKIDRYHTYLLTSSCDRTKLTAQSNEYFPFEQIQRFIDQCCPTQTILKKVILKFDCVNFSQTMWSTIVRYKTIFDHFHFYASFRLEDKSWKNTIISSLVNQFDFYIEDGDPLHAQIRFIHVYSLPFIFNKLHGFISCEELSTRSSFSSVRHLYFIQTRLARHISFASLANRMPRLMSMDCNLFFAHSHRMNIPEVLVNRDNFIYIRIFRYIYIQCDVTLNRVWVHRIVPETGGLNRLKDRRTIGIIALQWWNPENKASEATSVVRVINWIQRFGKCGNGPYLKYGQRCIRRALLLSARAGLLKRKKQSFLLGKETVKRLQEKKKISKTNRC
ncbi:hypothetical protein I4U23_005266 [Adineta vaga]|nr:hypothetical protein I4U23_005266 [Adineta vaga]